MVTEIKSLKYILWLIFILLNISELVVLSLSMIIYTSPFQIFPCYEPDSLVFLGLFFLSLLFLFIGIALFVLGRSISISIINKLLPYISIGLVIPVFLLEYFHFKYFYQIVFGGIVLICLLFCGVVGTTILNLGKFRKSNLNR